VAAAVGDVAAMAEMACCVKAAGAIMRVAECGQSAETTATVALLGAARDEEEEEAGSPLLLPPPPLPMSPSVAHRSTWRNVANGNGAIPSRAATASVPVSAAMPTSATAPHCTDIIGNPATVLRVAAIASSAAFAATT